MTTPTTTTPSAKAATSKGGKTSVRCAGPMTGLTSTSTGIRKSVIWRGLVRIVFIARSGLAFHAKRIPAAFSTAFEAIATITRPVKTGEMPRERVAGTRDETNQSETKPDATPATASTVVAVRSDQHPAVGPIGKLVSGRPEPTGTAPAPPGGALVF